MSKLKKKKSYKIAVINDINMTSDAWKILIVVFLAWMFDAVDSTIYGLTLPSIKLEFGLSLTLMGLIATLFLAGATIGSIVMPMIAEKYGRRWGIAACISVYSVFCGLVGISRSGIQIAFARLATGLGTGGEWPVGASYLSEVVPTKKRGTMMGLMQSGYPVGYFVAGGLFLIATTFKWNWRICYILMLIPAIICIPIIRSLKESPTWVKSKGLDVNETVKNVKKEKQSYAELFKPEYKKSTIIATVMHIAGGVFSWGINIWYPSELLIDFHLKASTVAGLTMLMWTFATFGYLFAGVLQDRIGRKKTIIGYISTALVMVILLNYLHTFVSVPIIYLYVTSCILGVSMGTHTVLITYTTEIYPSHVRTLGLGFSVAIGKIGSMLCPTLMGFIADKFSVSLALLFCTVIGWILVPIILQGPETMGRSLDDIATESI